MSRRLRRVNEAVREAVSRAVETEVKDPRLGFITVTGVETAPDLRSARVFVSVLGDAEQRADSLVALRAAHGVLQAAVAKRMRLKRTPRLEFVYDETTDRALHINELLAAEEAEIASLAGLPAEPGALAEGEANEACRREAGTPDAPQDLQGRSAGSEPEAGGSA